jgi:hypothetical protein
MDKNASFTGVRRWSASRRRTGALVMGAALLLVVAVRTSPKLAAVKVTDYHLIPVIFIFGTCRRISSRSSPSASISARTPHSAPRANEV